MPSIRRPAHRRSAGCSVRSKFEPGWASARPRKSKSAAQPREYDCEPGAVLAQNTGHHRHTAKISNVPTSMSHIITNRFLMVSNRTLIWLIIIIKTTISPASVVIMACLLSARTDKKLVEHCHNDANGGYFEHKIDVHESRFLSFSPGIPMRTGQTSACTTPCALHRSYKQQRYTRPWPQFQARQLLSVLVILRLSRTGAAVVPCIAKLTAFFPAATVPRRHSAVEKASKAVLGTPCISLSEPNTAMRCANCCGNSGPARSPFKAARAQPRFPLVAAAAAFPATKTSSLTHWKKAKHFFYLRPKQNTLMGPFPKRRRAHRHTQPAPTVLAEERPHRILFTTGCTRFREILHTEKRLSPAAHGFEACPERRWCRA